MATFDPHTLQVLEWPRVQEILAGLASTAAGRDRLADLAFHAHPDILAQVLGLTPLQNFRRIVLPQAVKRMIPAFLERAIELMKTTTLVATIAYADLLYAANEISQKTFRPLETFTVAALIYFVVITAFSVIARRFERRLAVSGEATVH